MTDDSNRFIARATVLQVGLVVMLLGAAFAVVSLLPVRQTDSPPFASPLFQHIWVGDAAAATRIVDLWGGEPLAWRVEPYSGAPNDRRVVQYFDRGRMEVESGSSQVTIGKLVQELVQGEIDLGSGIIRSRDVPDLPIDSGALDQQIPTYRTLAQLTIDADSPVVRNIGGRVTEWIDRTGRTERPSTPVMVFRSEYVEETGVHLPDVFDELFQRPEFQNERWVDVFGMPISEPFWAEYRRKDESHASLIQVFERRILIYSPGLDEANQFTVASSGRHYASWRYGQDIQTVQNEAEPGTNAGHDLTLADNVEAVVYADDIGTPIDLTLSATGHLMVLTAEGQILIARSRDPNDAPDVFDVWVDGITEPQGMVTRGDSVLLTADSRIWWYHDKDGRGVLDEIEALQADRSASPDTLSVRGKPVVTSGGDVFTRIESGDQLLLRALASDDPLVSLTEIFDVPGPVSFANEDLLITGRTSDEVPAVMLLPGIALGIPTTEVDRIASFSADAAIRAISIVSEELWPLGDFGDVFIAMEDGEDARIFAMSRRPAVDETEMVELVRGLSRPTALEVGLDGSLFVADSDTGQIIRIQYRD